MTPESLRELACTSTQGAAPAHFRRLVATRPAISAYAAMGVLLAIASAPASSAALDAGAPAPAPARGSELLDPALRTGREIPPRRARPLAEDAPILACSFTEAVCVHAARTASPAAILGTLAAAEHALVVYRALRLPPPLEDGGLGGSSAFDVYLVPNESGLVTSTDLVARGAPFDTESAFALLPPPTPASGCAPSFAIAQAVAEAILLRLDAGAEEGGLAMTSTYLASLAAPCSVVEIAAVDDIQRAPERAITSGTLDRPDGGMLFPEFLDDTVGTGAPAGVMTALFAVAVQRTPPGSWRYVNKPDLFDALRVATKDRKSSLDDLLLDYAVARAFVGSRSDGHGIADAARFGDMGRVRFDWSVPFASLPRRLAPLRPIDSTGATYLWLDLASAPPGSSLTFLADWELPVLFRWALVKVDPAGVEVGRVDVAGMYGSSHAERSIATLDGLAGILIVGVNDGMVSRDYPFDPDEAPFEPHGFTVTLAK